MVSGFTKQHCQRMKNGFLSLNAVRKKWWWKRKGVRLGRVAGVDWPTVEEAARNYELMRRAKEGKQFSKTYLELSQAEKTVVHSLWTNWSQAARREAIHREQYNEKGWTPFYENEHRQWNLRLADSELMKQFIAEIRILRKIQGVEPKHPLQGQKLRGVSWNMIEILDRKQNGIGEFNDSERHALSDARRRAEKYFHEYKRALDEQKKIFNPLAAISE